MFGACAELFSEEEPDPRLLAAVAPFGGGLGSTGKVCGTLAGALAVIGFTLGKTEPTGRDHKLMWKLSHDMVKEFARITEEYGGTDCADIAGVNWKDRESIRYFYKDPDSTRKNCIHVVRETSNYLYELISDKFPENDD